MQRRQLIPINQFRDNQIQNFQRYDPYQQVQRMMMSFGGLNNDPFLNSLMMGIADPFEDMFKFSDLHKNVHNRGTQGSYVSQSFVSTSKIGPNGQVVTQNYFQNNLGEHRGGNTISQKQQAYKNSSGVNRIGEQRMLNDRGRKIVRQKIGNNVQETNHYYNIDEEEAAKFDSDWRQTDQNLKFLETHKRYLQPISQSRPMQFINGGVRKQLPSVQSNSQYIQIRPDQQRIQQPTSRIFQISHQPQTYQQPYPQTRVYPTYVNSQGGLNAPQHYGYQIQNSYQRKEGELRKNPVIYSMNRQK